MKLKWIKDSSGEWSSECGRYHVWIQARPRECGSLWAAKRLGVMPWLDSGTCGSRREAQEVCQKHADAGKASRGVIQKHVAGKASCGVIQEHAVGKASWGVIHWAYKGKHYASPILTRCPLCNALAIILLPDEVLADQPDSTTHVCHPIAGGCNHGFDTAPEAPT